VKMSIVYLRRTDRLVVRYGRCVMCLWEKTGYNLWRLRVKLGLKKHASKSKIRYSGKKVNCWDH
jgi:hypothetical protein